MVWFLSHQPSQSELRSGSDAWKSVRWRLLRFLEGEKLRNNCGSLIWRPSWRCSSLSKFIFWYTGNHCLVAYFVAFLSVGTLRWDSVPKKHPETITTCTWWICSIRSTGSTVVFLLMLQHIICCFNSAVHLLHESYIIATESNGYTSNSNSALTYKKSALHFHGFFTFFPQQSSCSTFQNTHPWTYWVAEKPKATAAHTVVRFQHTIVLALGPVPKPHSCACPKSFWERGSGKNHLERIDGDRHSHVLWFIMAPKTKAPPFRSG